MFTMLSGIAENGEMEGKRDEGIQRVLTHAEQDD